MKEQGMTRAKSNYIFDRQKTCTAILREIVRDIEDPKAKTIAVEGPWGSGKTFIIDAVKVRAKENKDIHWVDFNPWFYNSTEQLTEQLFREITSQLTDDSLSTKIYYALEKYKYFFVASATVASKLEMTIQSLAPFGINFVRKLLKPKTKSIVEAKEAVSKILRENKKRIVICIDDIDRLSNAESNELLRLVRLIADFDNVTYILSFHRATIEKSILGYFPEGHTYLEKIVDIYIHTPPLDPNEIFEVIKDHLSSIQKSFPKSLLGIESPDHFKYSVIQPFIHTPRAIGRLIENTESSLELHSEEICIHDLFVMEVIKLYLPDLYYNINKYIRELTHFEEREDSLSKYYELIDRFKNQNSSAKDIINYLFIATQRFHEEEHCGTIVPKLQRAWSTERRIALHENLMKYLFKESNSSNITAAMLDDIYFNFKNNIQTLDSHDEKTINHLLKNLYNYTYVLEKGVQRKLYIDFLNYISHRFKYSGDKFIYHRTAPNNLIPLIHETIPWDFKADVDYINFLEHFLLSLRDKGFQLLALEWLLISKKTGRLKASNEYYSKWCINNAEYLLNEENSFWKLKVNTRAVIKILLSSDLAMKTKIVELLKNDEFFLTYLGFYREFSFTQSMEPEIVIDLEDLTEAFGRKLIIERVRTCLPISDFDKDTKKYAEIAIETNNIDADSQ